MPERQQEYGSSTMKVFPMLCGKILDGQSFGLEKINVHLAANRDLESPESSREDLNQHRMKQKVI